MAATEKAAKLARKHGLKLREIKGTGKGGKVVIADVKKAAKKAEIEATFGECPADITGQGERIWAEVKSFLESQKLWDPVFSEVLANYVRSILAAATARAELEETGTTTTGSQGQKVAHPTVKLRRDAELDALKYAQALLITPEAQQRHRGEDDDPDEGLGF